MWKEACWRKGKQIKEGRYYYDKFADKFVIDFYLKRRSVLTGLNTRRIELVGCDSPEPNGWSIIR